MRLTLAICRLLSCSRSNPPGSTRRIRSAIWSSKFMRFTTPRICFGPGPKTSPQQVKGSGVVIDGKRILTNAHVVRYASQIYVQPNQSASYFRPASKR